MLLLHMLSYHHHKAHFMISVEGHLATGHGFDQRANNYMSIFPILVLDWVLALLGLSIWFGMHQPWDRQYVRNQQEDWHDLWRCDRVGPLVNPRGGGRVKTLTSLWPSATLATRPACQLFFISSQADALQWQNLPLLQQPHITDHTGWPSEALVSKKETSHVSAIS